MEKPIPKTIKFKQVQINMMNEIMERKGFMSISEVVRNAVSLYHASVFKDYVEQRRASQAMSNKTPEERAEFEVKKREAKKKFAKESREEEGRSICNTLDGDLIEPEGGKGSVMCKYSNFVVVQGEVEISYQTVPIAQLEPTHIARQYDPSREEIEEIIK